MSVEKSDRSTDHLRWFKSSYSGSGGGDCVEVAAARDAVFVRDSKITDDTPLLRIGRAQWAVFVALAAR